LARWSAARAASYRNLGSHPGCPRLVPVQLRGQQGLRARLPATGRLSSGALPSARRRAAG
jgi:hypothetical protein